MYNEFHVLQIYHLYKIKITMQKKCAHTHTQVEIICTSPLSKYTHTYILVCQDPNQAGEQKDAKH